MTSAQVERSDWSMLSLAVCAAVVTTLVIRQEFYTSPTGPPLPLLQNRDSLSDTEWEDLKESGHWVGEDSALVVFVTFSDFQCPACRTWAARIGVLAAQRPGRVAVVFHHYPLTDTHPEAVPAAIASECATGSGKFAAYHDFLFRHQYRLGAQLYVEAAQSVGVGDISAFHDCMQGRSVRDLVELDRGRALALGVVSTPTVWVNKRRQVTLPDLAWVDSLVGQLRGER
jgi:protein-disulfide isomerase